MSCVDLRCLILPYLILCCLVFVLSCLVFILSSLGLSWLALACLWSCLVLSCVSPCLVRLILSCLVLYYIVCIVLFVLCCVVLWCVVFSCLVLFCLAFCIVLSCSCVLVCCVVSSCHVLVLSFYVLSLPLYMSLFFYLDRILVIGVGLTIAISLYLAQYPRPAELICADNEWNHKIVAKCDSFHRSCWPSFWSAFRLCEDS
jgi:hypothetical protein